LFVLDSLTNMKKRTRKQGTRKQRTKNRTRKRTVTEKRMAKMCRRRKRITYRM